MTKGQSEKVRKLKLHMERLGFRFGKSPKAIETELARLLGKVRYEEYLDRGDRARAGSAAVAELYRTVQTKQEAHLLMSHQADVELAAFNWLAAAVVGKSPQNSRLIDLGSGTGVLLSFLSSIRADLELTGAEREVNLVKIASEICEGEATIVPWDYQESPTPGLDGYETLVTAFGIEFDRFQPQAESLDESNAVEIEHTPSYQRVFDQSIDALKHWRSIAEDHASLFAVLRLVGIVDFVAFVDAAFEAGWRFDQEYSDFLTVGSEQFAALAFTVGQDNRSSRDSLYAWWGAADLRKALGQPLAEGAARAVYSALRPSEVRTKHRTYGDGHIMTWETGVAGGVSYLMKRASTGLAELWLAPLHGREELDELARRESDPAPTSWINL